MTTRRPPQSTWTSHTMWRCTRHIPSSMVFPAFVEMCPSCKQPRPPEDRRPADPYAPPVPAPVVVPSLPVNDADYAKDPEWVQGHAVVVVETPAPSECESCGKPPGFGGPCNGDFLVAPLETTPPPPPELWAMVSAQAQKELDASVLGGFLIPPALIELPPANVTPDALENMRTLREVLSQTAPKDFDAEINEDHPSKAGDSFVCPRCGTTDRYDPICMADWVTPEAPGAPEEPVMVDTPHPEPVTKAKKARCPGPGCRKNARESSPYCSKICSDRCLRLRKKATTAVLTKTEVEHLTRIVTALENWGK